MRDEADLWQVTMEFNRYDRATGLYLGYERMGGHTTIARAADTVNTVQINNMEYGTGWGTRRASAQLGTAGDGFTATFNDPTAAMIALGLNATHLKYDRAAGSIVGQEILAPAEGNAWYIGFGYSNFSDISVTRKNGLLVADGGNAATWAGTTTKAVGDYVVPTTNTSPTPAVTDHFYKVISAGGDTTEGATGDSGASEQN